VGGPFKALVAGVGSIGFPYEGGEFWAGVRILPVFILINGEECRKALSFVITPKGGLFSILGLVEGPWEVQLVVMIHPAGRGGLIIALLVIGGECFISTGIGINLVFTLVIVEEHWKKISSVTILGVGFFSIWSLVEGPWSVWPGGMICPAG